MPKKAMSKEVQMKKLYDERDELLARIEKRQIDIETAEIVNKTDKRKIREIEMKLFGLEQFFDVPRGADDWKLYDMPNADNVAIKLSKEFRNQLRWFRKAEHKELAFREVIMHMQGLMDKYKNVGAADTEPREVLILYALEYARRLGYNMKNAW